MPESFRHCSHFIFFPVFHFLLYIWFAETRHQSDPLLPPTVCWYLSVVLRWIWLDEGKPVVPDLHTHFCLSASSKRRIFIWHFCQKYMLFPLGMLPWISRTAPFCPRSASEGQHHTLEQGHSFADYVGVQFPTAEVQLPLKRNTAAVLWHHCLRKPLLLMVKCCFSTYYYYFFPNMKWKCSPYISSVLVRE